MRSRRPPVAALVLVLAVGASLAVACGSDGGGGGTCATTGAGTLVVNISGLPAGLNAKVSLTGPSGGPQTLSASQTLPAAAGGTYTLTADKVIVDDPIVRTVYSAKISAASACVSSGTTQTLTVTYSLVPTSNKIWLATSNAPNAQNTVGIASAGLAASGAPAASAAVDTPSGRRVVFDREGNYWSTGGTTVDPHLLRLSAASLAASGKATPDLKLNINGYDCGPGTGGLAFDKSGALWFAAPCKKVIYKLGADQLRASGDVAPALTIPFDLGAESIAFDKNGNLWVGTGASVARFDAAALTSASATPSVVLKATTQDVGGAELHPGWLAFDASGNLWTNDFGGNVVFQFPAAELGATSPKTIVPPALVTLQVGALLGGMAFDEGGGLWIAYTQGKFIRLGAAQLSVTTNPGSPTVPERVIASPAVNYAEDLGFYPSPAALPLYAGLP